VIASSRTGTKFIAAGWRRGCRTVKGINNVTWRKDCA